MIIAGIDFRVIENNKDTILFDAKNEKVYIRNDKIDVNFLNNVVEIFYNDGDIELFNYSEKIKLCNKDFIKFQIDGRKYYMIRSLYNIFLDENFNIVEKIINTKTTDCIKINDDVFYITPYNNIDVDDIFVFKIQNHIVVDDIVHITFWYKNIYNYHELSFCFKNNQYISCLYDLDFNHIKTDFIFFNYGYNDYNGNVSDTNGIIVRDRNKKCGLVDLNFNILIPLIYDNINFNGIYTLLVYKNKKYGVYDINGRELIPIIYKKIKSSFDNDIFICKLNDKYGIVDSRNNVVIDFEYDDIRYKGDDYFEYKHEDKEEIIFSKNITYNMLYLKEKSKLLNNLNKLTND